MKKVFVLLIVFSMIFSLTSNYNFSEEGSLPASVKYGDVNGDDNIDSTDCTLMKRLLLRIISEFPVSNGMIVADVNADQNVNSSDFTLLNSI